MPEHSVIADLEQGEDAILLASLRDKPFMPRPGGRKLDKSVAFRWAKSGKGGLKLETLRTPTGIITTRPAVLRFFAKLSEDGSSPVMNAATSRQRHRQIHRAEAALASVGI
jgi:hypothetical protein